MSSNDKPNQSRYRALFENSRDALLLFDRDGYFDCNTRAVELFGLTSKEEALTYAPWDLAPKTQPDGANSKEVAQTHIETAFQQGGAFFEYTHQTVGGTTFPAEVKLTRFEDDGRPVLHSLVRDITERKERERELTESEAKYRNLFESTQDALMLLDRQGFFDCNEQTLDLFRIESIDTFAEYTPWDLAPPTQPDGRDSEEAAKEHIETAFETGTALFEWVHRRPDGTEFPAEVKLSLFDHRGEPRLHALVRNISDRKAYERQIREQRDNLEILNQVLRHDIRNDIQLIMAYAELAADQSGSDSIREHLDIVLENAEHAVEITMTARQMAKVMLSDTENIAPTPLGPSLSSAVEEVQNTYPDAVVTPTAAAPETPVQANDMLEAVFRNLLKNAIQHNDKEVPEVDISARERTDSVLVQIADNGPGIPDTEKETIFGKGETGLDSSGTGLGLYLVKTLVESYGGVIEIDDNEPAGAVFSVTVPKADQ
ncbi:PAS domain-containing sensor histidine kinase [Halorubrum sp. 48-1-W]|uniref:sensor histidine kinase n=1 Tax=Halorubrum sp. 48-1-W TaxID=2249761 RepID=UPI0018E507C9|nr:PAS domain-containing sensor histidine kinase [Halorubrum sp. 48-1-W]